MNSVLSVQIEWQTLTALGVQPSVMGPIRERVAKSNTLDNVIVSYPCPSGIDGVNGWMAKFKCMF